MVSRAVPVPMVFLTGNEMARRPMVPLTGNEMALQPAPYVVMDVSEEGASDYSVVYASLAVCALAVAGVSMSKQSVRSNRGVRAAAPVMQLREDVGTVSIQAAQSGGSPKIQTDSS